MSNDNWRTIPDMVMAQVDFAKSKHPEFCVRFLKQTEAGPHIDNELAIARAQSDAEAKDGYSVQATLNEEVWEAMDAYAKGEYEHAIEELAQVAAVAMRAMNFIMEKHTTETT